MEKVNIIRHVATPEGGNRVLPRSWDVGLVHHAGIMGWYSYTAKDALQAYYAMRRLAELRDRDLQVMKRKSRKDQDGNTVQEWAFYDRGGKRLIDTFWFKV